MEFEIAYSMQSFRLITFEDSWAQELSTGPRVITKYTQIKAIKRVFLLITIALLHFRHKASTFTVPFGLNKRQSTISVKYNSVKSVKVFTTLYTFRLYTSIKMRRISGILVLKVCIFVSINGT